MTTINVEGDYYSDYLSSKSKDFETAATELNKKVEDTLKKLNEDPSNPSLLAAYQAALGAYTVTRTAQSTTSKALKDLASTILQSAR
ncbi:type III secretion system needle filament subunit SctF [Pseudomonas sp. NPDC090202]|uniref:type III secretion system needle filament subunit SctF n=1 Tax=unclassified Pseudomonas TaxID=196821 RepID=UPI0038303A53